ncbi:hypothetical protein ES708_19749 [subsurface metagenome]
MTTLNKPASCILHPPSTNSTKLLIIPDLINKRLSVHYKALVKKPDNNVILLADWHQI